MLSIEAQNAILVAGRCQLSGKPSKINTSEAELITGTWAVSGECEEKLSVHSQENSRNENSRLITPDVVA